MIAATLLSARNNPSRRCSVPTCLWPKRAASSSAKCNVCLTSAVRGISIEVDIRSRGVILLSISFRKASREPARNHKRWARALSFAHQPKEDVLGFYEGAAVLAGLKACEEDHATRFFREAFKHNAVSQSTGAWELNSMPLIRDQPIGVATTVTLPFGIMSWLPVADFSRRT